MQLHYTLHTYSMLYVLPNDSSITLVRILRFSLNASYKTHHAMILTTVIKIEKYLISCLTLIWNTIANVLQQNFSPTYVRYRYGSNGFIASLFSQERAFLSSAHSALFSLMTNMYFIALVRIPRSYLTLVNIIFLIISWLNSSYIVVIGWCIVVHADSTLNLLPHREGILNISSLWKRGALRSWNSSLKQVINKVQVWCDVIARWIHYTVCWIVK